MDSTTSSSMPIASRDAEAAAGTVSVDDAALSVTAGLAKEATLRFQAGKFADCLKVLNQLLQLKENDPKVLHNIAIAENFQNGFSDPKRLIEALEDVKKRSEELAVASGEPTEGFSSTGSKNTVGTKGSNSMAQGFSSSSIVYNDEFDTSVAMFNIAVTWFHLHDYAKSFSYLDALYQNIEPIDEGTALRICLLLLDVALLSGKASRSADVISYMEKAFGVNNLINQADNGNPSQQLPTLVSKSTSLPSNSTLPDSCTSDSVAAANILENSLSRTVSDELEEESLQLLSSLDISGQNLRRPGLPFSNDLLRTQAEEPLSAIDLRLKLHFYKVRFLLLIRNLKAAKREAKMAMNIARGKDYTMALYLKSQLEYARGNHSKAIKLLMASSSRTEAGISSMYYNNIGCIYYRLGKHHTSGVFFSKALNSSSLTRKEKPLKLMTFSQDKSLFITYNCGVHQMTCGKPFHAARCFKQASLIFNNRPVLWLRIAECCIMALEKGLIQSNPSESVRSDIRVNVIGKGKWRQLAVRNGISTNDEQEFVRKEDLFSGDGKQPDLSMSLARQCLINALHLLDCSEAKFSSPSLASSFEETESRETPFSPSTNHKNVAGGDPKTSDVASVGSSHIDANGEIKEQKGGSSNSILQNFASDYEDICAKVNHMIKQAVLADLAYVELALGNPLRALTIVRSLLKLPQCSRIYMFLGRMYAAEALCLLDQPKEAAEHLLTYLSSDNFVELPYSQEDCAKWRVEKVIDSEESNGASSLDESQVPFFSTPVEAQGILYANYAANYALLGDMERAHQFVVKALSEIPNCKQAILTAIFLDLKLGKAQEAVAKLKQYTGVRYLASSTTLQGCS
ncbi:Tetratricopeptide repeat (TPR)-like superfamily protein [Abeliophyllum distichum]|uniref:Tetratricopeptide repeat (TPR)-like superfamily protein n=1 Tax=Abeliophyllum distichum TaxID=126358 RepID=A0ABD1QUP0_9LAMI